MWLHIKLQPPQMELKQLLVTKMAYGLGRNLDYIGGQSTVPVTRRLK